MQKCDPLNGTHQPETIEANPTSATVLTAFQDSQDTIRRGKRSIIFKLTCEDKALHSPLIKSGSKIVLRMKQETAGRFGKHFAFAAALYFLPKNETKCPDALKEYN